MSDIILEKSELIVGVVVLYNPVIKEVLESINTYIDKIDKLICIDNSKDNHKEFFDDKKIKYISYGENKGLAVALNDGCKKAIEYGATIIITFDQDTYFEENCIKELTEYVAKSLKLCIVSPNIKRIVRINNNIFVKNEALFEENTQAVEWVITSGCTFRSELYENVNGFDSNLFVGQIDQDFSCRVKSCGYDVIRIGNVFMHQEAGNVKEYKIHNRVLYSPNLSPIRYYYIFRNEYYLRKKWGQKYNACRVALYKYIFYIVFFENNKVKKITSIIKGIKDSKYVLNIRGV